MPPTLAIASSIKSSLNMYKNEVTGDFEDPHPIAVGALGASTFLLLN